MSKKAKKDLAAMLSIDTAELAAITGGRSYVLMSVAAGTEASGGQSGDSTDAKHEHTDDSGVDFLV